IDFGIAKAALKGRRETEPGLVKGKFQYFSPEHARAEPLDGKSDVFALGVVLYRMLTGRMPFAGQMHEVIQLIGNAAFTAIDEMNPRLPQPVVAAVTRAMAKTAAQRVSALELQRALTEALFATDPSFSSEGVKDWLEWL